MESTKPEPPKEAKPPMDEMLAYATKLIDRRKGKWTLSSLDFDDVRQKMLIHIWQKYYQFDPKKGLLEHWINTLISSQNKNVLRDNLYKHTKPCLKCVFDQGGDGACGYTSSGKQCAECPLFKKWQNKKEAQHNIKSTLPLDIPSHAQEVYNVQDDFTDYDGSLKRIHAVMMTQLTPFERRLYRMLVIRHMAPAEVSEKLKKTVKKRKIREGEGVGYQACLSHLSRFAAMIKLVIRQEGMD